METLERTQTIAATPTEVFAFFSDPGNLSRITPAWLSFRVHGRAPSTLSAGSRIEYRIRWAFLSLRWITRITRWEPPDEFEDVQEKGPYARWVHTHRFHATDRGVVMEDRVEYELPFGVVGRLVHHWRVRRQLERIFDFRRETIARLFPQSG